ncbi:MAG: 50S ribosomal protein L10 [Candidatus Omnitrophica bacterium]|nr:50S ribosomal protein L10 [Candidatus Omnitrophota bacterium]
MKVGKVYRDQVVKTIKNGIEKQDNAFIVSCLKVSSTDLCALRKTLQQKKAKVYVSRNALAKTAMKGTDFAALTETLEGQTAFVWSNTDAAVISKELIKFAEKHEGLIIRGGILSGSLLKKQDVKRLADLPAKEVLLAQLLGTLQSPMTRLARALNGKTTELILILKQLSEKQGGK